MPKFLDVDPRTLHLPPPRFAGADPGKFARQLSAFGLSTAGMDPLEVHQDPDGRLVVMDGVTRATRVAKFLPGQTVLVQVTGQRQRSVATYPTVADPLTMSKRRAIMNDVLTPTADEVMVPEDRTKALELLAELSREFPRMRLGQLVCAVVSMAISAVPDSVYDIEDRELIQGAEEWLAQRRAAG